MKMGTALLYDEEMTKYKLLWVDPVCKIEVPERLTVSHEALVKTGLADRCIAVPVREATDADILLVHSEEYLEAVKTTPYMTLEELMEFTLQHGDVYFHPNIYHCAKLAAGATLQLVDSVMTGKVRNGMALVRPPGHHSMRSAANGFCVFNNVAIAARYAKQKYGIKRVLIVDWDVHHGQGVQYCFEDDPSVLYFSWHRYEHQKFWPQLRDSDYDSVGKEKGAGFNINVPWNKVGMKNSDYLSVFCHVLLPIAYEFSPDLVLVCAGFDSAIGDPEGEMRASPDIFAHLTHLLMNLAGGKLCAVLEGGYNLTSLHQSVCQTVQTLLGDPAPRPANLDGPCTSALESLHCVRAAHKQYWSCLKHAAELPTSDVSTKCIKLAEEEEKQKTGEVEKSAEEETWPEPPKRLAPPVSTALVLPEGVACPDGCKRFSSSEDPVIVNKLREKFLTDSDDSDALTTLSSLTALVEKMEKNEIGNGLALVRDVSMAMMCVVQHAATAHHDRVLIVCVGDAVVSSQGTDDGKTLLVQFSNKESEEQKGKFHIPVCLKKGCSDVSGFTQAVLGLLLPLGYEYDPSLVLLVRAPGSGLSDGAWQQLTGLLQGLAQGHTLVLMQEGEKACVGPTASSLLGVAAPPLGKLHAPLPEDVEALERLRLGLQADWKLLRTTAPETGGGEAPFFGSEIS
ncbi:polyamine deacetylase HDAC10 [Cyclopterus lumpus]|uniref:polyamine deacetylase HDAC10 n=1 Tax=Cyclopterus lumpus TaxID=8103 RepID=UPI001486E0FE|nr:polyamine deacetylase HDAC10 [Cyclopterus lumpus]XP_034391931.1 polyamine deacetylase HDAC10 [Cyclopterus lumpus]XP_034391932.1 polyamine deacetylase HDAC10 [Cyclopterus lumpus]